MNDIEGPHRIDSPDVTYRVMFDDGRVIDYVCRSDTSSMRQSMLAHARATGSAKDCCIVHILTLDTTRLL